MKILRYVWYTCFYLSFLLLAFLSSPILVLFRKPLFGFCNNNNSTGIEPRLPSYLSWFMTPDNSLWGDDGWKTIHCPNYTSYWGMVKWLYRNPAYGFATSTLSMPVTASGLWQKRLECKFGWQIENPQNGRVMYLLSIRFKDIE